MTHAPVLDQSRLNKAKFLLEGVMRTYHRAEASGIENVPDGGALLVGNHSGGLVAMDVPAIALAYWKRFGVERPLHVLAHDLLMMGPIGDLLGSLGFVKATRKNALAALNAGGATMVFPGGDFDVYRPTSKINTIDFNGRTGYVRTAIEAGVPIVPVVSIGGHETQIVLSRGETFAKYNPLNKLVGSKYAPITLGFPWGITMGLPQLPLPTKIVTRFLEPIDPADHGNDVATVDALVRERMQLALNALAAARRFPVLG
jgi:1-acyl-sn-glycerol-3-phosphate acyltransferase